MKISAIKISLNPKSNTMAKYSKGAGKKVKRAMHESKLESGRSGKKVKSRKQAIAIGLSEARKEGSKVPKKGGAKKAGAKKGGAKKGTAKKRTAKKGASKRGGAKKGAKKGGRKSSSSKSRGRSKR
jgi:hypothetical protein